MNISKIMIAGTNSGCGKTTISIGIMSALVKRGYKVQPFKAGPDYIDPMFHTFITERHSRNLDSWLLEEDILNHLFYKSASGADISVIEGVMGLYDGYGGYSYQGSSAHVAEILNAPIVLVVSGEGISLSIVPLVKGFIDYNPRVNIKGIIINNIKSENHYELLKENIEENLGISVLGYLPASEGYGLQKRHLGLVPAGEVSDLKKKIDQLSNQIEKTINMELLIRLSSENRSFLKSYEDFDMTHKRNQIKLGIAKDKAFSFYYRDNLDLLETLGAELIDISPLKDDKLPDEIDGLYIGGGYPENMAYELEANKGMRENLKSAVIKGLPVYAECGGLMYMTEKIINKEGKIFEMAGIIPAAGKMTSFLQRFGYVEIEALEDNVLCGRGDLIRGHEFHYSLIQPEQNIRYCFKIIKKKKGKENKLWSCGFKVNNLLGAYPHLHFWSNIKFAESFIDNCIQYHKERRKKP